MVVVTISNLTSINVTDEGNGNWDVTFCFDGKEDNPYNASEFLTGTATRRMLESIEAQIIAFNREGQLEGGAPL